MRTPIAQVEAVKRLPAKCPKYQPRDQEQDLRPRLKVLLHSQPIWIAAKTEDLDPEDRDETRASLTRIEKALREISGFKDETG